MKALHLRKYNALARREGAFLRERQEEMKTVRTVDAVGHVLCHDITQIVKGVTKDARFRKGHIVTEEDIPILLSLGKENLYVWEKDDSMLHENEAAAMLRDMCLGEHMGYGQAKEGKIEIFAQEDGYFVVDRERLAKINSLGRMMIATRHGHTPVKAGDKLCGTRIIPLLIEKDAMEAAKQAVDGAPILQLYPYQRKKIGIVTTGSEVYKGLIQDTFGPVVMEKLREYGGEILGQEFSDDDPAMTQEKIQLFLEQGADMVVCTGGMSVDPDDKTPLAIRQTGAEVVSYGAPVLPGAMFLLAYLGNKPIVGLPGCVMYAKRTIFDIVLPALMSDYPITAEYLAGLGEGGLCLSCPTCIYPNCGFGKGR